MLLGFGAAWPLSVYKSYHSKTNKGKSIYFIYAIFGGYLSGITYKITSNYDWVVVLYIVNTIIIGVDILLYHRNKRYDIIHNSS